MPRMKMFKLRTQWGGSGNSQTWRGTLSPERVHQPITWHNVFFDIYMKMKQIRSKGGTHPMRPPPFHLPLTTHIPKLTAQKRLQGNNE